MNNKYLEILRIEIDDLADDIGLLVDEYRKRRDKNEITNYVFLENLAVLHNEMQGVDNLVQVLDGIDPNTYTDLDAMVSDIKDLMKAKIKTSDLAEALWTMVCRKADKVAAYIRRDLE